MNKNIIIIGGVILTILLLIGTYHLYKYIRVKTAKIEVVLQEDLTLEFTEKKKVSDFIISINGKITDDFIIDSESKLGKNKVSFTFINEDNIKVPYHYEINIVDKTPPLIWLNSTYRVPINKNINLEEKILCGDNYDNNPKCFIEGTYDLNKVGKYPLIFNAIDNSGNKTSKKFTLDVYEPKPPTNQKPPSPRVRTDFQKVLKTYKSNDNKVGLDISKWQEDVDFAQLKNSGVEFVMIRVGSRKGQGGELVLDPKFKQNITGALEQGIEVGIYFYSYASSIKDAKEEANWVLKQIKDYNISMPVVFDWEEWNNFNSYNLSFYNLTKVADEFLNTFKKKGYKTMLYSSKTYLENIWFETSHDIWLAHYTKKTNYQGTYRMWQLCNNGKIDGIKGDVDIDIFYPYKQK